MASEPPAQTEGEAAAAAGRLTKLDTLRGKSSAAKALVGESDIVPFCPGLARDMVVWKVEFDGGALSLKSAVPGHADRYPGQRKFTVLLDTTMRHVLSIRSEFKGDTSDMVPEPSAASAEEQMHRRRITYAGPPEVEPRLTFSDALDAVLCSGLGNPLCAREIWGSYVMYSELGSTPVPAWVITLRGLPPMHFPQPSGARGRPAWHVNRMLNVVNAMTGEVIVATNTPLPDAP